ncbi:GPO family capsid scaffolding protein [Pasteurella multocida]|uniref:GPO family capsid scaffolding protein n=1 Tax=Pasteurella multocida TaxID=747 RepID=UPI002021B54C|nr:GPO family capsid scaffolding protein [Pasteurella multocida]MCL7759350.1 GPO family capsid scaffolding protein [Pasteurella multocida]
MGKAMGDKKTQSKWFVVATEGATTDGRTINRVWIEQMAKNYDPKTYGARINLEHYKTRIYWDDFAHSKAYGDVIALKTQETEDGKLQLLAQIDPTDDLIKLNKDRQKVYTSIEVDPNFSGTGEAYLVGLAVTDEPASLGTEMLQFASQAKANPFTSRKQKAENLFTAAVETEIEFEEIEEKQGFSVFEKVKALFAKKAKTDDERFTDHQQAIELLGENCKETSEKTTALSANLENHCEKFADLENTVKALEQKFAQLENQPEQTYTTRPQVTGAEGKEYLTDC